MPVMKKAEVTSEKKVVGVVEFPFFDEKNPDLGLQDILDYNWSQHGYASSKAAIVALVNTQHATNLKNDLRAKASGKLTGEKLTNMALAALATIPSDELAALAASGKIGEKVEELKASIKAKHEADRAAANAAAPDADEESEA